MKNKLIARSVIALIAVIALLAVRWDRVELESRAFALCLMLDTDNGGYIAAASIADNKKVIEGGEEPSYIKKANGQTLKAAIESLLCEGEFCKVYLGHTMAIIINEALLSNQDELLQALKHLEDENEVNIKAILLQTNEKFDELLSQNPKEAPLGIYIAGVFKNVSIDLELAIRLLSQGIEPNLHSINKENLDG